MYLSISDEGTSHIIEHSIWGWRRVSAGWGEGMRSSYDTRVLHLNGSHLPLPHTSYLERTRQTGGATIPNFFFSSLIGLSARLRGWGIISNAMPIPGPSLATEWKSNGAHASPDIICTHLSAENTLISRHIQATESLFFFFLARCKCRVSVGETTPTTSTPISSKLLLTKGSWEVLYGPHPFQHSLPFRSAQLLSVPNSDWIWGQISFRKILIRA